MNLKNPPCLLDSHRFTLDGSAELEQSLAVACSRIAAAVRDIVPPTLLAGLVLGGGYGRGEGGVLSTSEGDLPYNDLEFYVFLRFSFFGAAGDFQSRLQVWAEKFSHDLGIEVEFKFVSLSSFRRASISMFFYDLYVGHKVLIGNEAELFSNSNHAHPENLPLSEASRLLLNRCTGLLLARKRLENRPVFSDSDADFVGRNVAKADLAIGDAVLMLLGVYHGSVVERNTRLQLLLASPHYSWSSQVLAAHCRGLQFKLRPQRTLPAADLYTVLFQTLDLAETVWLAVESRRLFRPFSTIVDYAFDAGSKCPELSGLGAMLRGFYHVGLVALSNPFRHPRERLFNTLPLLLWRASLVRQPAFRSFLQQNLLTNASDLDAYVQRYLLLWSRVR